MIVIGVDPGAKETGMVVRHGVHLLGHRTFVRGDLSLQDWLSWVSSEVHVAAFGPLGEGWEGEEVCVAVEDTKEPDPHIRIINLRPLIGTAQVQGAVVNEVSSSSSVDVVVIVPPGGNGSGPLSAYPSELRPTTGRGRGKDNLRHERSSWDVAGAAVTMLRQQETAGKRKGSR